MEDFRSKSCRDGRNMQLESYNANTNTNTNTNGGERPNGMHDLRSYSTNHAPTYMMGSKDVQIKKGKNTSSFGSTGKSWSLNDPELKRKKRVAGYKVYSVEGKMKGSLRKSFRWIKDIVYGRRVYVCRGEGEGSDYLAILLGKSSIKH